MLPENINVTDKIGDKGSGKIISGVLTKVLTLGQTLNGQPIGLLSVLACLENNLIGSWFTITYCFEPRLTTIIETRLSTVALRRLFSKKT